MNKKEKNDEKKPDYQNILNPGSFTIAELRERLKNEDPDPGLIESLRCDERKGVQKLADRLVRKKERREEKKKRWKKRDEITDKLRKEGYRFICGLDEAGRGALAGPVAAAAVILPCDCYIPNLDDSKQIKPVERERLAAAVKTMALAWEVEFAHSSTVDEVNVLGATKLAMKNAIKNISINPNYLLIDGNISLKRSSLPQRGIKKGDARVNCIAAASILAKVSRDSLMEAMDRYFPAYNFHRNMGYGTDHHRLALKKYGPSQLHRRSYRTVRRAEKNLEQKKFALDQETP